MQDFRDITVFEDSLIIEVLKIIDKSSKQIALVVDENDKLIGTISDGDIRRGFLNNLSLRDSIKDIYFKFPTVATIHDSKEKIIELCSTKRIYQIPIVDDNQKLVGIEILDELLTPKIKSNRVVLMVGGLGTRLRPLTDNIPKPMLKVGNKPILETIILNFKKYGFVNFILCVSYKSEIIEEYFKDGRDFGVNIEYIHEEKRMGTAGALSLIDKENLKEPFFVMNGDLLTNMNFENMMNSHIKNNAISTMGVREYDFQVPYGVVNVKENNIVSIEEKPTHRFFVSAGVYILATSSLEYIPQDTYYDMPTLFESLIGKELKSISFPIHEYWLDIGRMDEFEKANREFMEVFNV